MANQTCPHCLTKSSARLELCPGCGEKIGFVGPRPGSSGNIIAAIAVVACCASVGFGAYAIQRYDRKQRSSEATYQLGGIALYASRAYARQSDPAQRHLCRSASRPVPASVDAIRGKSYQSDRGEWSVDGREPDTGFACLRFAIPGPQKYQYSYESDDTHFVARAIGDTDGDGVLSTFEMRGQVVDGRVVIDPKVVETNPSE